MEPKTGKAQAERMHAGVPAAQDGHKAPPSLLILLIIILFFGGLACLRSTKPWHGWIEALYHSIGLLTHDSSWAFDPNTKTDSAGFRFLAVIGPLLTAATVTYLLADWLRPFLIRSEAFIQVRIRGHKCVALIGLTENSFALAASLRTTHDPDGEHIVPLIFSDENSGPLVERCRRYGIAIYPRHARGLLGSFGQRRSRDGLLGIRKLHGAINRARDLISFLPIVAAQVDFLVELQSWMPPRTGHCRAWILLEDRGLTQRLESQYVRYTNRFVTPRLLATSTLAARQLLMSQQFDTLADAFGQAQIHLAIYGMGDLGRAIVKEAAQLYVTRPALQGLKLRITFFDANAQAAEDALFAEDPGLRSVIDLAGHTLRIEAAGLHEPQLERLAENVTGHIITFEDGEAGFSLAVSLRRWLLEPPPFFDEFWRQAHHAAPIFVRVPSWQGLGRLLYKPSAKPAAHRASKRHAQPTISPMPDGIIGFGAIEGLFGAPELGMQQHGCLLDTLSELGAQAVHEVYRGRRANITSAERHVARAAEADWDTLSPQLRESNFRAFDHIAIKARAIGYRVVRHHKGPPPAPPLDAGALETLEKLEHLRYHAERTADGWRYAPERLDAVCVHPDLVDWTELGTAERELDFAQVQALPHIAAAAKQVFANALIIGVVGHRPNRLPADTGPIRAALRAQLHRLVNENSARAPLLLTALAPGADSLAAEVALELNIPFMAPHPLPYELYREDFSRPRELDDFHRLAAAAELHIELPLRFGRASQMTTSHQSGASEMSAARRAHQYALAGAYIVQRAHVLVAVSDGGGSHGIGGTAHVLAWWNGEPIPEEYTTPDHFFARPLTRGAAIIIDSKGTTIDQPWQALHAGQGDGLSSRAV